ncbi:MAG: hypothetical protein ACI4N3_04220 [Alphaproteobacteria bacterium]
MKYINEVFPEFEVFAKLFMKEKETIKTINKIKKKGLKDLSKLDEKTVIKLRDYNFVRFFTVLRQMDIIANCHEKDKGFLAESLVDMLNPYSIAEIFYSEWELLDTVKVNKLDLNANIGTDGFDFFVGKYLYELLERYIELGFDLDMLRHAISIFTDDVDLNSIKKEVMKVYDMKIRSLEGFDLGAEYFKDMKYNINVFFTSGVKEFYIPEGVFEYYEGKKEVKKTLKMPKSKDENSKNNKTKPVITSTINKDKER